MLSDLSRLVSSPIPLKFYGTNSTSGFQHGIRMIVECIGNKVIVWGGKDSLGFRRDPNLVHIYDVEEKSWIKIRVKGDFHPGSLFAASVVNDDQIVIFGGQDKS